MNKSEQLLKAIETKFELLRFTNEATPQALQSKNTTSIDRQRRTLENKVEEVHCLKVQIQELKLEQGIKLDDVRAWSTDIEGQLSIFEQSVSELEAVVNNIKCDALKDKEEQENEAKRRQFEEELKFEQQKFQCRLEQEKKIAESKKITTSTTAVSVKSTNTKLPKLVISKFNGKHTDWLRFWNQFREEIDNSDAAKVTKFSYLKELVEPKVRICIDGLPFTSEGYERAKNILQTKYGKTSEVVNAYVQNILGLPTIHGSQPAKIHSFFEALLSSVQSLETLGKLIEVSGYVRMTIDKLEGIRSDLVRTDDNWREWKFPELVEALRKWTDRNPLKHEEGSPDKQSHGWQKRSTSFHAKQQESKFPKSCVYCEEPSHRSIDCKKVVKVADRKKILEHKKLCFNCTGQRHRAADCRSQTACQKCKRRHHTSICEEKSTEQMLIAKGESKVIYPVVVVKAGGIECRALLDTGAGSSYASAALLEKLRNRPIRREFKRIEMMMQSTNRNIEIHKIAISNLEENFQFETEVTKVDRANLLCVLNPRYKETLNRFSHLKGITMADVDEKPELPIHLILGASDYAKAKTATKPRVGQSGEPVAELTKFGWTLMSPGTEDELTKMLFSRSSSEDYEKLCGLDVLGLEEQPSEDQTVYQDFKDQLAQSPEGWYETGLLWKPHADSLPSHKAGSLARLEKLVQRLEKKPELFKQYQEIIKEQEDQGIIEKATEEPKGREFYLPHKPVVKESAESTKVRIVYDASAKASDNSPSLNDCLETGPSLQNLMWDILVRNRFKPVALSGDLKQAFLQVRIKEADRDVLRFHWIKEGNPKQVATYRFTRALFGLNQSPFLLGGTLEQHLSSQEEEFLEEVAEIKKSLYVDDLLSGGNTVEEARHLKQSAIEIFNRARFKLHKWHSNVEELESKAQEDGPEVEQSYGKQQLGEKSEETKLLGLSWNKVVDKLGVIFPLDASPEKSTKRSVLSKLASIFDPLGFVSPITVMGKMIYRDICESHSPWDKELPSSLMERWQQWCTKLPRKIEVPRSLVKHREEIQAIDLHAFGDTSGQGTSAAVYAVVHQKQGVTQGLIAAKARLAKKGLTIPRLELVSGQMAMKLMDNVKKDLEGYPVQHCYGWLDSTVALYWINGYGNYKQFVGNRVKLIREKSYISWRHVGTRENPADVGSRGCHADQLPTKWLQGPEWLSKPDEWPKAMVIQATEETEAEVKQINREVFKCATKIQVDELDNVLAKHAYWKAMRVTAWVARFLHNLKSQERRRGPLSTEEIQDQIDWWIKREENRYEDSDQVQEDKQRLNLQKNEKGLLECRGRIQGEYPIYIPPVSILAEKMVMHQHLHTLHGGVGMTMSAVRKKYWIPRLRQLTKRVRKGCNGCKRFHTTAFAKPPTGNLPTDRTEGSRPFQVIGVDYAGPIIYKKHSNKEAKAYLLLFGCSLTRAVHLEVLPDLSTEEFIQSLKRFMARRGKPDKIYSDNAKTFVAAAKRVRKMSRDEQFNDYLAKQNIKWQFNLSKAPWWGGQYERLIGLVKQALYKVIGRSSLKWKELVDVILDVEICLNNRPLAYVEDDLELPVLTPNVMITGQSCILPEEDEDTTEEEEMRKRAKHIMRCKRTVWKRWTGEYLRALRERHNLKHGGKGRIPEVGEVVLIKNDSRNRGKWNIGIVKKLYQGRDGVVRGAELKTRKTHIDRALQHLYPLELFSAKQNVQPKKKSVAENTFDPEAVAFKPRRRAAAVAEEGIKVVLNFEET